MYIFRKNIPYGQSSAKLPVTQSLSHLVTRSLGHLSSCHICLKFNMLTNGRTHNIRTYRSASQTNNGRETNYTSFELQMKSIKGNYDFSEAL